ncbi:MAG: gliding motility-associated C-terminal domain-containing protein [Flavobacteriales bacterium]|nr:gliding motility-associated C-terminal domain-containing protein [Flavobacteriales bacterium]
MKKLIALFIGIGILVAKTYSQGSGTCAGAAASPITLPFSASNQSTCGMGNTYTGNNTIVCGNGIYLDGENTVYAFTPTSSGLITITLTSSSSWVGIFLYQGCPTGGTCVANSTSSTGNQSLTNIFVTSGVTYYLVVDKWLSPTCFSYNLNITAPVAAPPPTVQDCLGAIPVCQNTYSETNAYQGTGNILNEINATPSCLKSGEKNDVWYTFTTQTAGNVCFTIVPNQASDDYDWAVYNLTSNSCADIYNNSALEVSCNYSGLSGNTGPNGLSGGQNNPCIAVQAGQTYVVNVSQYSTSLNGYTINFGASTATIFDNVPPAIQTVNGAVNCGTTSIDFIFTENVLCAGMLASDFTLTGPSGSHTVTAVQGVNCANGASQDRYFSIDVNPPISDAGTYTFCLTNDSSSVKDLCGNYAIPNCINFDIVYPVVNAGLNDTITCQNLIVTLNGSSSLSGTYSWSTIGGNIVSGQTTLTPQVNQAGLYILTVTSNNCSSTDTVEIFQDSSLPISNAGSDTALTCLVDTIQLSGFVSGTNLFYYWTGPSFVSGDSTLTPVVYAPGTYTLIAKDTVNQCQAAHSITVADNRNLPIAYAGNNATINCTVDTITLNGTGSSSGVQYSYQWTDSLGNVIADSIIGIVTVPGVYTLTVYDSLNGCMNSDFITITIDTILPNAAAGADTSLNCTTITTGVPLNGTGSTPSMNYQWSTNDGNIVNGATSNTAFVNSSGTYTLTVTNPNNNCVSSDIVVVTVDTLKPTADAGNDMVLNCNQPTVNLDGTASSFGTTITYNWTGGSIVSGSNTNSPLVNGAGTYTLTVTNTSNNCVATDMVTVSTDFTQPGANAGAADTICTGESLVLTGTTSSGTIYYWSTSDGKIVSGDSTLTPTINSGGTYTLTTISPNGCQSTSSVYIHEYTVSVVLSANPTSGQMPLTVTFTNTGVADSSYWNFGNGQSLGDTSTNSTATIIYETQGSYTVTLTSFNGQCSATTQITIEVHGTSFLTVPNIFTPNGDDKNDVFEFIYQHISEFNCVIFNRWGKQVAEITAPDKSWDGKIGGSPASDGTYYYIIKAKGLDDVQYDLKGTITLVR